MMRDTAVRLSSIGESFDCIEDGDTFEANAIKKAREASQITGQVCLADDSGLCIKALNNEPGIYSARYFANGQGMQSILERLREIKETTNRAAYFVCALALSNEAGEIIWQTEAHWAGHISHLPIGDKGFGYDPIFIPEGFDLTVAQLDPFIKESHSHRAQAVSSLIEYLCQ